MKGIITVILACGLVAGCENYQTSVESVNKRQGLKNSTIEANLISDQLIIRNHLYSEYFLKMSDKVQIGNHLSTAVLLTLAGAIAVNSGTAAAGVTVQRTLAGLFLEEGLNYVNPREAARALRISSSEATCIAVESKNNAATRQPDIILVMQQSRMNLRERMVRKRAGLIAMIDRFSDQNSDALYKEDKIGLENKLNISEAEKAVSSGVEADKPKLSAKVKLLKCLK
mgnify:CR=1 FL=1